MVHACLSHYDRDLHGDKATWSWQDANFLAYGLARTGRDADAAQVFASIGRYMTSVPWSWWGRVHGDTAFIRARRRARHAA